MRNFDEKYLQMAKIWSTNSYAIRHKVGAIIVKDGIIISDGFNGTPAGFENECEEAIPCGHSCSNLFDKNCGLCSEANAILKVAKSANSTEGATLYCTLSPCIECAKLIIQAGIIRVVYIEEYRDVAGLELLKRANIEIEQLKI